jgi:fumarate hydratase class II
LTPFLYFELNVFKPLIAVNVLQSASLIGDAYVSLNDKCAEDFDQRVDPLKMVGEGLTPFV